MKTIAFNTLLIICLITGVGLTAVNIYGLFVELRPEFHTADLSFEEDHEILSYQSTLDMIRQQDPANLEGFLAGTNKIISEGLAHVEWHSIDKDHYHQHVPIWENYFLYFMGVFSGIPEFERYHFTDYKRSLRRGFGICGDASIILSEILNEHQISNKIVSFPEHVVTVVKVSEDKEYVYDPDFGIHIPYSIEEIQNTPSLISPYYSTKELTPKQLRTLEQIYEKNYKEWDGVKHFQFKKYYFERFAYFMKWPFPLLLVVFSILLYLKKPFGTRLPVVSEG